MDSRELIDWAGGFLEAAGVAVIVLGSLASTTIAGYLWFSGRRQEIYSRFRRELGRSILLGLELLVGADIVRTVAVTPNLNSVLTLGLVVLIRTFLSFSLELEISGRWPWQKKDVSREHDPRPDPGGSREPHPA